MTSHYFGQKSTPSPPCHISSQVFNPPWNITSQFATPTIAVTNFHLFCVCLDKNFICFIDLICTHCDKTQGHTSEKFRRGQKSLLAMIMTSSMCSQPWCDLFAMISLPIKRKEMMINSEKRKLFYDHYRSHILLHQTFFKYVSSNLFEVFRCKTNKSINLKHQLI